MTRDLVGTPIKTAWMHGADLLASGIGAFSEAEKARVDGKFNAPLNIKKGTSAYNWLLDDVIEDEYKNDFRREVKNNNLFWTELNKFAEDKYIGGGQLAKGINARNEGIISTDRGTDAYEDLIGQGKALRDTGMLGDAAADQAEWLTRTGQPFDMRQRLPVYETAPAETVTPEENIPDIIGDPYGPERQEGLDWDTSPEEQELLMNLYRDPDAPPQFGEKWYRGENPFRESYFPMEGPSPIEGHVPPDPTIDELAGTGFYNPQYLTPDEHPMVNPIREPVGPMGESWTGQTYGPVGLDAYWDREDEEEIKARLWGPWRYPELSPAGQ